MELNVAGSSPAPLANKVGALVKFGLSRLPVTQEIRGSNPLCSAFFNFLKGETMRMWMVDPRLLCNQHLIGEHGEIHKFLPSFRKGHKVDGRFDPVVQIQFNGYLIRHDMLAEEMLNRGMNHKSPLTFAELPDFKNIYPQHFHKEVDLEQSIKDLLYRCEDCSDRIIKFLVKNT